MLAVGNLVRVYRTDDIAEMGGAWAKLRTTSVALGVWALLAGGIGFGAYYALSSALSGINPAGGVFSASERVVVIIVTIIATVLGALLAGRLLLSVTSGAVTRRRGFQHDRVGEVENAMRRPIWLAIAAAVIAVLVGLPGVELFNFGGGGGAAPTFMRFVFYGLHHQAIGVDGIALLVALLVLACGFGAAYLWFNPGRNRVVAASGAWPVRYCSGGLLRRATHGAGGGADACDRRPCLQLR